MTGMACAMCGEDFDARRSTARYCSASCRAKASKQARRASADLKVIDLPARQVQQAGVAGAVRAKFDDELLAEPVGQVALRLAEMIDAPRESGGIAAEVRELRQALAALEALAARSDADPLTRMRRRYAKVR